MCLTEHLRLFLDQDVSHMVILGLTLVFTLQRIVFFFVCVIIGETFYLLLCYFFCDFSRAVLCNTCDAIHLVLQNWHG